MQAILSKPYSVVMQGYEENSNNDESADKYIPGVCNIGKEEIEQRKKGIYFALALLVAVIIVLQLLKANPIWRIIVFIPAASFAVSFQQWYFKFCLGFGLKGIFNFGEVGKFNTIEQKEYYKKDKAKAIKMIIYGIIFGLLVAVVYCFL
jgi:hypothetical protein